MVETVLQAKRRIPHIPNDIPEVEYPEEVIERLNREFEVGEAQLAIGEIKLETAKEFAARYGIVIEDDE